MFKKIYIESEVIEHKRTLGILEHFKNVPIKEIDNLENIFNKVKRPYLTKREELNLFIGAKKGNLVKEAPDAYGLAGEPHYYFIHAYNCIYECNYCYLQGYFHSPDLVLFVNHEEILQEMQKTIDLFIKNDSNKRIWFHAGEYSDSLALSHMTGELPVYFDFFKKNPRAILELRTKSANVRELLKLEPLENIVVSVSMSPAKKIKDNDLKTPPLKARLKAIEKLHQKGHPIGLHFDPIIFEDDFEAIYTELIKQVLEVIPASKIQYISVGVVRFTKDVFSVVKKNYPESELFRGEFIKSFDNKVRYPRPLRLWILQKVKALLIESGIDEEKVYLCME